MSNPKAFFERIGPLAQADMRKTNVLASLTLAQAALESAYGESGLTKQANNLFGMKPGSSWTGKTVTMNTFEYYNGKKVTVSSAFRAYPSWEASIADHSRLFTSLARYAAVVGEKDYKRAAHLVWKAGYATDPNYPVKLVQIIEQYELYKYDKEMVLVNQVADYAQGPRELLMKYGVTDGTRPKEPVTREETWVMLNRLWYAINEQNKESKEG